MKLDKRTKDVMMALVLGIIIGAIVYFVQRKFSREGYEGEEKGDGCCSCIVKQDDPKGRGQEHGFRRA